MCFLASFRLSRNDNKLKRGCVMKNEFWFHLFNISWYLRMAWNGLSRCSDHQREPWKINMAFFIPLWLRFSQEPRWEYWTRTTFRTNFHKQFSVLLIETHHTKTKQQSDEEWEKLLSGGLMNFSLALVYLLRGIWEVSFNVSFASVHSQMSIWHILQIIYDGATVKIDSRENV